MKKADPVVVIPVAQHVGKPGAAAAVPVIECDTDQKLIFDRHARGFFDETPGWHAKDRLFVRKEKMNQIFVIIKQHGNAVEQMGLAHAREKFVRIGQVTPPGSATSSFHMRYKIQSWREYADRSVNMTAKLRPSRKSWNLYPSRFFVNELGDTFSCDLDDRALLPDFPRAGDGLRLVPDRSRTFGKARSNSNGRDSSSCTWQRVNRTIYMKECIPQSDPIKNSLNESDCLEKERRNQWEKPMNYKDQEPAITSV